MQPISQLGDVAFKRPSITADGVENRDMVRDLTLPDIFASFVGDLSGDAEPEDLAEEAAADEAIAEPDTGKIEDHEQSDAGSKSDGDQKSDAGPKSENHQKSEAIAKSDDLQSTNAVFAMHEEKSSEIGLSYQTEIPPDAEQNNFAPRTSPKTRNDAGQLEPAVLKSRF